MSKKAILSRSRNSESQEGMHLPEDDAQCSVPNPVSSTETVEEQMKKLEIGSSGGKIQSNDIPMEGACGGKDATPEHTSRYYLDSLDRVSDDGDVKRSSRKKTKAKRSRQAIALPGCKDPTSNDGALLWKNVKFFIRDTMVFMKIDGQKLFAERRISPDEFRVKFCLPLLVDLQNRDEMLRQKKFVDMEIERQWQEILDEDNVELFTDAEIFKGELTHAFELSVRESAVKVSFNGPFIKSDNSNAQSIEKASLIMQFIQIKRDMRNGHLLLFTYIHIIWSLIIIHTYIHITWSLIIIHLYSPYMHGHLLLFTHYYSLIFTLYGHLLLFTYIHVTW